jgi:hypothetical protein
VATAWFARSADTVEYGQIVLLWFVDARNDGVSACMLWCAADCSTKNST